MGGKGKVYRKHFYNDVSVKSFPRLRPYKLSSMSFHTFNEVKSNI